VGARPDCSPKGGIMVGLRWRGRAGRYPAPWCYFGTGLLPPVPGEDYLLVEVPRGTAPPAGALRLSVDDRYVDGRWCDLFAVPDGGLKPLPPGACEKVALDDPGLRVRADQYLAARGIGFGWGRIGRARIDYGDVRPLADIIRQVLPAEDAVRLLNEQGVLWVYPVWACPDWKDCARQDCASCRNMYEAMQR